MSRLARRGRVRRTLLSVIAASGLAAGMIPGVQGAPASSSWSVDRTEVVVGAARFFTFSYTGGSASSYTFKVPADFSAPSTAADRSSGSITGVGWVSATDGVRIVSISGQTITLNLTGPGKLRYFGRTNATGRNEFTVGSKPARGIPVWGRPAKISVVVTGSKKVASTSGTMSATALVTDVNGVVQDKVVLYFGTSLPGGTVYTAEADGVAGCSGSSVDGVVCTGADGKAGVTFKHGTAAGCYQVTAQNRARPQSYNGSASFQVWPDVWVRDSDHVSVQGPAYLGWHVVKYVKVYGYDKWDNRANITSGDRAYLTQVSGSGRVYSKDLTSGSAAYSPGSCRGAPAVFDVKGKKLGIVRLRGWLRTVSSGDTATIRVVPGVADDVHISPATLTFSDMTTAEYVEVTATDGDGNQICDLADVQKATDGRNTSVVADPTGKVTIDNRTFPSTPSLVDECEGGYSGSTPVAKFRVRAATDGTTATSLYGRVDGVVSGNHVDVTIDPSLAALFQWLADTSRTVAATVWTGAVVITKVILGA